MSLKNKIKQRLQNILEISRNSKRIIQLVWGEKGWLISSSALVIILLSTIPFARAGLLGSLINSLTEPLRTEYFGISLIGYLLVTALFPLAYVSFNYVSKILYLHMEEQFELALLKKRGEIDVAHYENAKYQNLLNKVNETGMYRANNFLDRQFYILQNLIEVGIASIIIIFFNPWLFLLIFLFTIPEIFVETKYGEEIWSIHGHRGEVRRRYWDYQGHFRFLPSLIELKVFQNLNHFFKLIRNLFVSFQREILGAEKRKLWLQLTSSVIGQGAFAISVVWFVFEVKDGVMLVGTLIFLISSISDMRQALSSLFNNVGRQYQDSLFVTDLFKILDLKSSLVQKKKALILSRDKTPSIEFRNVTFKYPGTTVEVLKNFSLTINPGEKLALIGINGAGKTTLVKLLCRFYDPIAGTVLIDGHDLKGVDFESWYHHLGVIFQDYAHYHLTVKEAIAIGRTGNKTDTEKVIDAAKSSEADTFIMEWEKKYNQMLGKEFKGGIEPSIGQWQKLALARTFYRDPRILILDEPTSSIDAESEAQIFERLERLPSDRTVILISHRFSTVRHADKIAVIKDGDLAEYGRHEELMTLGGIYAHLFNLQAKGYK